MNFMIFFIVSVIFIFVLVYRKNTGDSVYKYITTNISNLYNQYAPFSFKVVREKIKDLGQEYTPKQYALQVGIFAVGAAVISYLYFYNLVISIIYVCCAVAMIPYLAYLRCKRLYSEYIFEQIQVYTTNTIMEFATTQSFVKALEGVYESGVLEDPVLTDVKMMIDLAYANGTINQSLDYMNSKYDYYIVKNMHQLFLQITKEGAKDSGEALENMSMDIDSLVEGVYRDQMDRKQFHTKFITFALVLFLLVLVMQVLLGKDSYLKLLDMWYVHIILHAIIFINCFFLLSGEKYYNDDVGVE